MTAEEPRHGLALRIGHNELVVRRRYEALSIGNDVLIGVWFLIGSILFFSPETSRAGTWLFVIGSIEMLIRPVIRLTRAFHLQRLPSRSGLPRESSHDF